MILEKRKKYLQIALNSTLEEAKEIIGYKKTNQKMLEEAEGIIKKL